MKLKTLKNLFKKEKEYHQMFPPHWKYSEDFHKGANCAFSFAERKLKQEAIKWVKELENDIEYKYSDDNGALIEWIKHFFNITEEDLK